MKEEILEVLKVLLSFKTIKGENEEFKKLFKYVKDYLKELVIKEYDFDGKKGLVVANNEELEQDIVFCTHVDVVEANSYSYSEDDTNIYGRGTIDMKGSVAVCLVLMKYLKTSKRVALFITTDEEIDGFVASKLAQIYKMKLAIVPDGGSNFDLINEEKGLLQLKVSVRGRKAHSSQPFNGENAISKLMDVYQKIIEKYPLPKDDSDYVTSVNIAKISGGIANNLVPDYAEMVLDIRHILKDKKKNIISYIKKLDKSINVEVILEGSVFNSNVNNPKIKKYIEVCKKVLGRKILIKGCESTSDAIYFSDLNVPTIIMNPDGYYAHSPNEYVNKESLAKLYEIYVHYIEEDCNEGE